MNTPSSHPPRPAAPHARRRAVIGAAAAAALLPASSPAQTRPRLAVPRALTPKSTPAVPTLTRATEELLLVAPYYQLHAEWQDCASFAVYLALQMARDGDSAPKLAVLTCSEKTQALRSLIAREVGVEQAQALKVRFDTIISEATRLAWAREHPPVAAAPVPRP